MKIPRWGVYLTAALTAVAVVAAVATGLAQRNDLRAARDRADRLQRILATALERLDELEESRRLDRSGGLRGGEGNDDELGASSNLLDDLDLGALSQCLGDSGSGASIEADGDARSQIRAISKQVEDIRNLDFRRDVKVRFLTPRRVAERAAALVLKDYPASVAASEERVLAALGAIPHRMDLRKTTKELLESQVAGFYVPRTGQLVVPSRDPAQSLTANEKIVLAHELEHAVADQRLGLPVPEQPDPREMDRTLAALSVAEGDATLTMQRYALQAIPIFEQLTMMSDPSVAAAQKTLERTPHFLAQQLIFPYTEGLEFDCALFAKGGWRAVNRAYDKPPTTSAQVMFPDRYLSEESAADVSDPSSPGRDWAKGTETTFGAAHLLWLFQAPGGDPERALDDPEGAAGAWAGGEVHLFVRRGSSAVALVIAQRFKKSDLCTSVVDWYEAAFEDNEAPIQGSEELARDGASQDAVVSCSGDEIRLGIGPDLATARALVR